MKRLLLATTAAIALIAPAQGADMPVKARPPAAVAAAYNWTGFYIGAHGGAAWSKLSGIYDTGGAPGGPIDTSLLDDTHGIVGGQIGYLWQHGMVVFGVEVDASKGFNKHTITSADGLLDNTTELDWLFSARARLGLAVGPRGAWLPFVTAGWGRVSHEFGVFGRAPLVGVNGNVKVRKSGFVGGGGLEYGFTDWLTARVEYLHYATPVSKVFGDEELIDSNAGDTIRYKGVNVVRGAINIKFNPVAPVVARY